MAPSSEAQMKSEIARLTATINQHKSRHPTTEIPPHRNNVTRNAYVNPNYKPANKYIRPGLSITSKKVITPQTTAKPLSTAPPPTASTEVKEVVLGGVAFESSGRSLVRKDLPKLKPTTAAQSKTAPSSHRYQPYVRNLGQLIPPPRPYKSKSQRGGPNMTLNNTRRPYQSRRAAKQRKYSDKPCPRFTTTGSCSRGLTCMYQHDASKIAICWNFLHGTCPNTAETCALSHDPTPERTPLCLHFLNGGRCTRVGCPFPHVNVGARNGICRDFAVLGYCERGLDCDKQHVRECPDFAEKGACIIKGCKLPHVIRANRSRKAVTSVATISTSTSDATSPTLAEALIPLATAGGGSNGIANDISSGGDVTRQMTAENAKLGDEYISLTFNESESSDDEEENDSDEEEEGDDGEEDGDEDVSDHNRDHEVDQVMNE